MRYFILLLLTLYVTQLISQITDSRMYIFGHSLIDHRPPLHPTPSNETTVAHWLALLAEADAARTYAATGQYGLLTVQDNLPPTSQWGYDIVTKSWNADIESFGDANINTILLTAGNFMQTIKPTDPHWLDATTSVLHATQDIFDWVDQQGDSPNYYVYINWPEMDLASAYPDTLPTSQEVSDYHNLTKGAFLDWWIEYQDSLIINRPEYNVRFIPVGPIISKIITELLPDQLPFDQTYEDSAPHGYPNLYYLASLVTYMAIYEARTPDNFDPGDIIHPSLRNNYNLIRDVIWQELLNFNFENGESRVFTNKMTTYVDNVTLEENALLLTPNPNNGSFKISGMLDDCDITIVDTNGVAHQILDNIGQETITVQLENLPPGLYFIRIVNTKHQHVFLERVIKH